MKTIIGMVIKDINVETTIMLEMLSAISFGEYIEEIKYVIQVNGKLRGEFTVDKSTERDDILVLAKENQNAKKF